MRHTSANEPQDTEAQGAGRGKALPPDDAPEGDELTEDEDEDDDDEDEDDEDDE